MPLARRSPDGLRRRFAALFGLAATKPSGVLLPAAITAATLLVMPRAGIEVSAAILPSLRVLAAYGVFFGFGWLLYGRRGVIPLFASRGGQTLAAGAVVSGVYLASLVVMAGRPIGAAPAAHVAASVSGGLAMWLLIFGILGMFVRFLEIPRPLVRYFSDASYWMYLVHLPVVIWLTAFLATVGAPAVVKFAVVLIGTALITTVSYHYLVRPTAIGALLNGRRYEQNRRVSHV